MRRRPYAFLRVGDRWINMTMVTDVEDHGNQLIVFLSSDMARLAGRDDPQPLDVARRIHVTDTEEVDNSERGFG